jgi:methylglyoxal synthase
VTPEVLPPFTGSQPRAASRRRTLRSVPKRIALVAHDGRKHELLELVGECGEQLRGERLVATETTGRLVAEQFGIDVELVASGPFGGDLQIGALVAAGEVKLLVFLRDPLAAQPHEPAIEPLLKVCDVHRVPVATNLATALLCVQALAQHRRPALTAV